jgi:proline iminopeptidase
MRSLLVIAGVATGLLIGSLSDRAQAWQTDGTTSAREKRIPAGKASLYSREIGSGPPIIVLHGGPDFDSGYLLPDLDGWADAFRLIYYDQRGRGRSAGGVLPEDVSLKSDVDDIERVRQYYRLTDPTLLGHSWGALLALEYALRYPKGASRIILMNPAPASASDLALFRDAYVRQLGAGMDEQRRIVSGNAYKQGDPEAVAARYRIHFRHALTRSEDHERLMTRMRSGFIRQGAKGIVKARAVEDRLMRDTWHESGYDLVPKLHTLNIPTLVIFGEDDFIPSDIAGHIARAIPNSRFITLKHCGHFAYMECAQDVRRAVKDFFAIEGRPR